jgi:hypothetical protein
MRGLRSSRWSGGRQLLARIPGLFIDFRPIRKARAHALDHCFEAQEQFLPLFVESLIVPQRDYHFEALDDLCRVLVELFCFIKHFSHRAFASAAGRFGSRFSGCSLVSQDHPYCDFKIKIIKWLTVQTRLGAPFSEVPVRRGFLEMI